MTIVFYFGPKKPSCICRICLKLCCFPSFSDWEYPESVSSQPAQGSLAAAGKLLPKPTLVFLSLECPGCAQQMVNNLLWRSVKPPVVGTDLEVRAATWFQTILWDFWKCDPAMFLSSAWADTLEHLSMQRLKSYKPALSSIWLSSFYKPFYQNNWELATKSYFHFSKTWKQQL